MSKRRKVIDWIFSTGRYSLVVMGHVVATEGDVNRDSRSIEINWTGEDIKAIARDAQEATGDAEFDDDGL